MHILFVKTIPLIQKIVQTWMFLNNVKIILENKINFYKPL